MKKILKAWIVHFMRANNCEKPVYFFLCQHYWLRESDDNLEYLLSTGKSSNAESLFTDLVISFSTLNKIVLDNFTSKSMAMKDFFKKKNVPIACNSHRSRPIGFYYISVKLFQNRLWIT